LRDCTVYKQRAYATGLAHFFSWLHASGGDPYHVTQQTVGSYITEFARGTMQGAVGAQRARLPGAPASAAVLSKTRRRVAHGLLAVNSARLSAASTRSNHQQIIT
jgi:hypothetical protein